ncbi:DUF397 domain-containing protein [Actinomadura bangladeshensis]|uniref:DUF397 domain-containing protein n=1 Tax=Actinomadura bangladeshensis TaxID=453573 RepID=A0A4R4NZ83_9ACTN|nr:DUF397 domain-containing protein [Actinomadura bangladeshensis]TDC13583.1 DUF397 domain-containing protein [Actinomadura bangladeshensis]
MNAYSPSAEWRISSYSAQGATCVEVAKITCTCLLRDSTDPDGAVLTLTVREWATLLHVIKTGAYDQPG